MGARFLDRAGLDRDGQRLQNGSLCSGGGKGFQFHGMGAVEVVTGSILTTKTAHTTKNAHTMKNNCFGVESLLLNHRQDPTA